MKSLQNTGAKKKKKVKREEKELNLKEKTQTRNASGNCVEGKRGKARLVAKVYHIINDEEMKENEIFTPGEFIGIKRK